MDRSEARWPPALLIAFRFGVCFFAITTLYLAIAHLSSLIPFAKPVGDAIAYRGLFAAYHWGTEQLFGPVVLAAGAAGLAYSFLAYMSTALVGAGAATIIWSLLDRGRLSYQRAHAGLRIYLRYLLAAAALSYGVIKVLPAQFSPPSLVALITPLGEFTRMRLLWHFMGSSTGYVVFTGLVEVIGALLLLWRRTTPLGALLLAAAFANVTVLNFGYEVGVQLNSMIYLLMALTLLAPDARRLAMAFLDSKETPGKLRPGRARFRRVAKALVILLLLGVNFRKAYQDRRYVTARPELYGIYEVEQFARDSVPVPPGDPARWLRFVVAERGTAAIQWTDGGRVVQYGARGGPEQRGPDAHDQGAQANGPDAPLRFAGGR